VDGEDVGLGFAGADVKGAGVERRKGRVFRPLWPS